LLAQHQKAKTCQKLNTKNILTACCEPDIAVTSQSRPIPKSPAVGDLEIVGSGCPKKSQDFRGLKVIDFTITKTTRIMRNHVNYFKSFL
jgi:hypothetical protein